MKKLIPLFCITFLFLFRVETAAQGEVPSVAVVKTNGHTIAKYEKFEVALSLEHVGIHNPYDPDDIDVYAYFVSPLGDSIRINGFYDNYRDAG
ncbi:MAG TPA: hypothetical protein VI583_14575, partial [Cyclobacteriaceae bacterium]|nr:hypothetical protein [Cyclobacteriaceae bacterium]